MDTQKQMLHFTKRLRLYILETPQYILFLILGWGLYLFFGKPLGLGELVYSLVLIVATLLLNFSLSQALLGKSVWKPLLLIFSGVGILHFLRVLVKMYDHQHGVFYPSDLGFFLQDAGFSLWGSLLFWELYYLLFQNR